MKNKKNTKKGRHDSGLSLPETMLAIAWEMGMITIKSFFPHPYSHMFCSHRNQTNFNQSASRLLKRGLIHKQGSTFRLTEKGEEKAFFAHFDAQKFMHKSQKQKWDGYWRMIIFDIPEKKRRLREYLRQCLRVVGFKELQRSVWVTPYKIPKFIEELLWEDKIKYYTRFITIKEIDYDTDLRRKFKIKHT